ncbi:MAG: molybdopterin-dependent oxidoreductase [Rhodobacteraceae bacterium]|nr:molybdopterin-dependent oxidoreductase [Paracoccaceae bacterium]
MTVALPVIGRGAGVETTMPDAPGWTDGAGNMRYRIDAHAKVTGAKVFPRDIRGRDMPGWPAETHHAMMLFATDATHVFEGIDLSALGQDFQPDRIVLAEDLAAAGLAATGFFASNLFATKGAVADFLGQPVAMLIYADFNRFATARSALTAETKVVKYGAESPARATKPYGAGRYTRVAGENPAGPDQYSVMLAGGVSPQSYDAAFNPVWSEPAADGDAAAQAAYHGAAIRQALAEGKLGKTYAQSFQTQSIEPMFMEPESGLAWYDAASGRLSMVIGVQSPDLSVQGIAGMVGKATDGFKVTEIDGQFLFMGGSFGAKDHTIFPLYAALAGLFGGGKTVRLAFNRFEQFQFGLKRHAFRVDSQLGVDPATGGFTAFVCDVDANGGGVANLSGAIAGVGAVASSAIYYMPQSDVTTVARQSIAVTAGSMRGFGSIQTMTAMEVLVDQVARDLGMDPFEIRQTNTLQTGWLTLTGNPTNGANRTPEVLAAMEKAALWADRAADKAAYEAANPGFAYGVGVACVMKKYGGGVDSSLGTVTLAADGGIAANCGASEMGTGVATAVARRVADHLGHLPDQVQLTARGLWDDLQLVAADNPWGISQADQDAQSANPRWTLVIDAETTASNGASACTQAPDIAAWVVLRCGLWPAARAIWSDGAFGGQSSGQFVTFADLRWVDGRLTAKGMQPLTLEQLAERAHRDGLVTGAMAHGANRWMWSTAQFTVNDDSFEVPIDALAIRRGGSEDWELLDRDKVTFPAAVTERIGASYFSTCGAVVAMGVDRISGETRLLAVHQVLECGRVLVPDIVQGMTEGGIAMGVGQALYEDLPLYEDGPGNGTWNLNSYRVPMSADLPLDRITVEVLPPLSETDAPKGMAELVMIPVVPGILNAICDAVGARVLSLPATPQKIMEAL